jgi:Replication-relaxation
VTAPFYSPGLSEKAVEIVASLAQHRVLSTAQVRAVHLPCRTPRRTQQVLAALEADGLVEHVELNEAPRRLWHPTESGARIARDSGLVGEPVAGGGAAALRAHTLAVNEAAICFLRRRGSGATSSARSPGAMRSPTRCRADAAGAGH